MPRISVVIPCRDGAEFLGEALASVRAQTRAPDEVIVVDDRSSDRSAAVARAAGARVLRTRDRGGVSAARNLGWRAASGDLIAFLDADDRWRPQHLERVAGLFERFPDAVLAYGLIECFGLTSGPFVGHLEPTDRPVDARLRAAMNCCVPQMSVIIPRARLEDLGGYDEDLTTAEDFDLFARLAFRGPFIGVDERTAEYRQHDAQATRRIGGQVSADSVRVRARCLSMVREQLGAESYETARRHALVTWRRSTREAWLSGDEKTLDGLLAVRRLVLGSSGPAFVWRVRRLLLWHPWRAILWAGRRVKRTPLWTAGVDRRWRKWRVS